MRARSCVSPGSREGRRTRNVRSRHLEIGDRDEHYVSYQRCAGWLVEGISECVLYSYGYVMGLWFSVLDKVCSVFRAKGIGEKEASFMLMGKR